MDNYDDFEFKPLTQGLGFHKKSLDMNDDSPKAFPKTPAQTPPSAKRETVESVNRLIASIPTFDNGLSSPLPREEIPSFRSPRLTEITKKSEPTTPVMEPMLGPKMDFAVAQKPLVKNRVSAEPLPVALAEARFSIPAFFFDVFVAMGLTCLFTGIVLAITKADFSLVMANAKEDVGTRLSLVLLVMAVIELYVVLARSFFGATLGEWAFDIELGNKMQQRAAWYPLAVVWRTLLIMLTGFVLFPLLSLITGRDIVGKLSGPRLYRKS